MADAPIGRRTVVRKQRELMRNHSNAVIKRDITLCTGRVVTFYPKVIPSAKIPDFTFVDVSVNGRNQSFLNQTNTSDIGESIEDNQFYLAYGCKSEGSGEKYSLLDGSRRSHRCMMKGLDFEGYFTDEVLTHEEQVALARQLQTAKSHNVSEQGVKYKAAMEREGLNQKEVAKRFNVSEATVTRALKALEIPHVMLKIFPDLNKLGARSWDRLHFLTKQLTMHDVEIAEYTQSVESDVSDNLKTDEAGELEDVTNEHIFDSIEVVLRDKYGIKREKKLPPKTHNLKKFKNKNIKARKKESGSMTSFELVHIPKDKVAAIEALILKELEDIN